MEKFLNPNAVNGKGYMARVWFFTEDDAFDYFKDHGAFLADTNNTEDPFVRCAKTQNEKYLDFDARLLYTTDNVDDLKTFLRFDSVAFAEVFDYESDEFVNA